MLHRSMHNNCHSECVKISIANELLSCKFKYIYSTRKLLNPKIDKNIMLPSIVNSMVNRSSNIVIETTKKQLNFDKMFETGPKAIFLENLTN